jgi:SAM-dependent methyltransferase
MPLKTTLLGIQNRLLSTRYLARELAGVAGQSRSQEITFNDFERYFSGETQGLKSKRQRLARIGGRFARLSTLELEVEFVRTHIDGIASVLGSRAADADILEVGAGYGRTLIPLSYLAPNARFSGLEYTRAGPSAARRYLSEGQTDIGYVVSRLGGSLEKQDVWKTFQTGNGKAIPWPDNSFDVAYTNLVLEQIPDPADHSPILKEMYRVSRKAACFLEPWADAQSVLNRAYIRQISYFGASTAALRKAGFSRVEYRTLDFQHNLNFRLGYAIAHK